MVIRINPWCEWLTLPCGIFYCFLNEYNNRTQQIISYFNTFYDNWLLPNGQDALASYSSKCEREYECEGWPQVRNKTSGDTQMGGRRALRVLPQHRSAVAYPLIFYDESTVITHNPKITRLEIFLNAKQFSSLAMQMRRSPSSERRFVYSKTDELTSPLLLFHYWQNNSLWLWALFICIGGIGGNEIAMVTVGLGLAAISTDWLKTCGGTFTASPSATASRYEAITSSGDNGSCHFSHAGWCSDRWRLIETTFIDRTKSNNLGVVK